MEEFAGEVRPEPTWLALRTVSVRRSGAPGMMPIAPDRLMVGAASLAWSGNLVSSTLIRELWSVWIRVTRILEHFRRLNARNFKKWGRSWARRVILS